MGLRAKRLFSTVALWSLVMGVAWAAPDSTMSIAPTASSGATITASDENTRNNAVANAYNSHSHTDITQTGTSLNIGASSGRTSIGDASVVLEGATNNDNETTITVTDPTADRTITVPNETGNLVTFTNANTQDVNLIFEGATANDFETTITVTEPTADRTITVPDASITLGTSQSNLVAVTIAAATTGAVAYTGMGFQATSLWLSCTDNGVTDSVSFGMGDDDNDEMLVRGNNTGDFSDLTTGIVYITDGTNEKTAVLTSLDSDGFTLTWSNGASGIATDCVAMGVR